MNDIKNILLKYYKKYCIESLLNKVQFENFFEEFTNCFVHDISSISIAPHELKILNDYFELDLNDYDLKRNQLLKEKIKESFKNFEIKFYANQLPSINGDDLIIYSNKPYFKRFLNNLNNLCGFKKFNLSHFSNDLNDVQLMSISSYAEIDNYEKFKILKDKKLLRYFNDFFLDYQMDENIMNDILNLQLSDLYLAVSKQKKSINYHELSEKYPDYFNYLLTNKEFEGDNHQLEFILQYCRDNDIIPKIDILKYPQIIQLIDINFFKSISSNNFMNLDKVLSPIELLEKFHLTVPELFNERYVSQNFEKIISVLKQDQLISLHNSCQVKYSYDTHSYESFHSILKRCSSEDFDMIASRLLKTECKIPKELIDYCFKTWHDKKTEIDSIIIQSDDSKESLIKRLKELLDLPNYHSKEYLKIVEQNILNESSITLTSSEYMTSKEYAKYLFDFVNLDDLFKKFNSEHSKVFEFNFFKDKFLDDPLFLYIDHANWFQSYLDENKFNRPIKIDINFSSFDLIPTLLDSFYISPEIPGKNSLELYSSMYAVHKTKFDKILKCFQYLNYFDFNENEKKIVQQYFDDFKNMYEQSFHETMHIKTSVNLYEIFESYSIFYQSNQKHFDFYVKEMKIQKSFQKKRNIIHYQIKKDILNDDCQFLPLSNTIKEDILLNINPRYELTIGNCLVNTLHPLSLHYSQNSEYFLNISPKKFVRLIIMSPPHEQKFIEILNDKKLNQNWLVEVLNILSKDYLNQEIDSLKERYEKNIRLGFSKVNHFSISLEIDKEIEPLIADSYDLILHHQNTLHYYINNNSFEHINNASPIIKKELFHYFIDNNQFKKAHSYFNHLNSDNKKFIADDILESFDSKTLLLKLDEENHLFFRDIFSYTNKNIKPCDEKYIQSAFSFFKSNFSSCKVFLSILSSEQIQYCKPYLIDNYSSQIVSERSHIEFNIKEQDMILENILNSNQSNIRNLFFIQNNHDDLKEIDNCFQNPLHYFIFCMSTCSDFTDLNQEKLQNGFLKIISIRSWNNFFFDSTIDYFLSKNKNKKMIKLIIQEAPHYFFLNTNIHEDKRIHILKSSIQSMDIRKIYDNFANNTKSVYLDKEEMKKFWNIIFYELERKNDIGLLKRMSNDSFKSNSSFYHNINEIGYLDEVQNHLKHTIDKLLIEKDIELQTKEEKRKFKKV